MKKETREKQDKNKKVNISLINLKSNLNSQRAITLIALIITIVVLLILAGVSLNIILGENGIIKQAKENQNEYEELVKNAQGDIDKLHNELIGEKGDTPEEPTIKINKIILSQTIAELKIGETLNLETGLIIEPENATNNRVLWKSSNSEIAKVKGGIVTALSEGTTTIIVRTTDGSNLYATCIVTVIGEELPSTDTTKPYLPGDDFQQVPGTDLDNGLVIEDNIGNQYVSIEVTQKTEVYPTAGLNITEFTSTEYTKIEKDLHTYTNYYRKNKSGTSTNYTDKYYADSTTGWFANATEYNTLKQKMLKSVYQNGGFWIGRYEAGIDNPRNEDGEATITPVSKANQYPYMYVTRTQAHVLAKQVNSGNYNSSLLFGVQWDLALKFIEVKEVANGKDIETIQYELRSDSSTWGNYGGRLLKTGASDKNKKMNIYDLAGNACERTLEYTSSSSTPCASRGGYYGASGSKYPANYRAYGRITSSSGDTDGFRVALY